MIELWLSALGTLVAVQLFTLKGVVVVSSFFVVGLALYLAQRNFLWWAKDGIPRRWGYALAFFGWAGAIWEVAMFAVLPAVALPTDWKTLLYLFFLVCGSVGIAVIVVDYRKRRRARPPVGG